MKSISDTTDAYLSAVRQVRKIKGFYTHLLVYIVINVMVISVNIYDLPQGASFFRWQNFGLLLSWGIGILAHFFSTFLPIWFFGTHWEQRKIKEFIQKEQNNRWE